MAIASGFCPEAKAIAEALLGPGQPFRRLVIDIDSCGVVKLYVERFATTDGMAAAIVPLAALISGIPVEECESVMVMTGDAAPNVVAEDARQELTLGLACEELARRK